MYSRKMPLICVEDALYHRRARRISREGLIDPQLLRELLCRLSGHFGLWNIDHSARMDLVDVGDGSFPNPMHTWKSLLNIHDKDAIRSVVLTVWAEDSVFFAGLRR